MMTALASPASSIVALSSVRGFGGNAVMKGPDPTPGRVLLMYLLTAMLNHPRVP
jgi:hypothetical protein